MSDVHIWPATGLRAWLGQHLLHTVTHPYIHPVKQVSSKLTAVPITTTELQELLPLLSTSARDADLQTCITVRPEQDCSDSEPCYGQQINLLYKQYPTT